MKKMSGARWTVVAVVGLVLAVGAAGLAAGIAQSSGGGYFTTPSASFRTSNAVLLTDEIDVDTGRPADPEPDLGELGRVRVRVVATGGPGLDIRADLGLRFGFLSPVGGGLLALGVLLLGATFAATTRRPGTVAGMLSWANR